MKKLAVLLLATLGMGAANAANCYRNGETVTLQGNAVRQYMKMGDDSTKGVWVLALDEPVCVIDKETSEDTQGRLMVSRVQLIGTPPPEEVSLELTGKLSTGNLSQYYIVPTALWVQKGRKVAP
jgi:hypothetical protein